MERWFENARGFVVVLLAVATGALLLAIDPGDGFPRGVGASGSPESTTVVTTTVPGTSSTTTTTTTTTTPATTRPTLQQGSQGPEVTALQQRLAALGYNVGTPDGVFGAGTKAAVVQFQTKSGLTADGIVSQATWAALDAAR